MDDNISMIRNQLLDAALDEFAEKGYGASSLETIAGRAGLNTSQVRALFQDKNSLFKEVLKQNTDPFICAISLAVEELEDPMELLHKSMELCDNQLIDNPRIVELFKRSLFEKPEVLMTAFEQTMFPSEYYERIAGMMENGQMRKMDIMILLLLMDSMIMFPHFIGPALKKLSPDVSLEHILKLRFEVMMGLLKQGIIAKQS